MSTPASQEEDPPLDSLHYRRELTALLEERARLRATDSTAAHVPYTSLVVIDFDNTLFRSPAPSPALWHPALIERIKAPEIGWFQDPRTLADPYTPFSLTDPSWFISPTLSASRRAISTHSAFTILLTGRARSAYRDRILSILAAKGLAFDLVVLREHHPALPSTVKFKIRVMADILAAIPSISAVRMWDDRPGQVATFQRTLAQWKARSPPPGCRPLKYWDVILVPDLNPKWVNPALEEELVSSLILERNLRMTGPPLETCPVPSIARIHILNVASRGRAYLDPTRWAPLHPPVIATDSVPVPLGAFPDYWEDVRDGEAPPIHIIAIGWDDSSAWAWMHLAKWGFSWRQMVATAMPVDPADPGEDGKNEEKEPGYILLPERVPIEGTIKCRIVTGYVGCERKITLSNEVRIGKILVDRGIKGPDIRLLIPRILAKCKALHLPLIPPLIDDITKVIDEAILEDPNSRFFTDKM